MRADGGTHSPCRVSFYVASIFNDQIMQLELFLKICDGLRTYVVTLEFSPYDRNRRDPSSWPNSFYYCIIGWLAGFRGWIELYLFPDYLLGLGQFSTFHD